MQSENTGGVMELASRLYNSPLAIHPDVLQFIGWCKMDMEDLANWMSESSASAEAKASAQSASTIPLGESRGSVAVIPIRGSLMRSTFFSDYDGIADAFDAAMADPSVSAVMLDVDSPGGEVRGMFDLADKIYAARGQKPIIAHANDQMTSAAYAVASSADQVIASPTATLGSIGVVAMHVDQSQAAERAGLKFTEISSGTNKTALSPNQPLSDLGRAVLQKAVAGSAEKFFDLVARNRDLPVDAIRSQQAGVYFGSEAVENGLADRVASRSTVLQELSNPEVSSGAVSDMPAMAEIAVQHQARSEGSEIMADDAIDTTQVEEETPLAEVEEIEAEETEVVAEVDDLEAARAEGRAAGAQEAQEIIELCTIAGVPGDAVTFIAAGEKVETVRARLLESKAVQAESDGINNQVDALTSASEPQVELDPYAIYRRRAEEAAARR